ncbi:MAG: LytTR family DNA-binding domain-containing protein [Acidobacteriales bacterium]|nr:LytTR family DNA-binding domain-containing protein [Terriglobales bacterium]
MRAMIIDDERLARNELRRLLASFPEIEVVSEAKNADEAIRLIEQERPELLFLDVQMPGKTGFELLEELETVPPVIFTTAYDEFALRAFEVNALDYLLKPIVPERLGAALSKIVARKRQFASAHMQLDQRIFVKDGERCWFVALREIMLFESEGNYTRVYFGDNRPLLLRSLNYLEERLDPHAFFRVSRKHIVNLRWVEAIEPWMNSGFKVKLRSGLEVEMSRRQSSRFRELMSL